MNPDGILGILDKIRLVKKYYQDEEFRGYNRD